MDDKDDISAWPDDLVVVFRVIGESMNGGRLTPEIAYAASDAVRHIFPGQEVEVTHGGKGTPDAHHYLVEIFGDRWAGARWRFRSGVFEHLCRQAARGDGSGDT